MGGPSAHGQRNKAHKSGRSAGKSARERHRDAKDCVAARPSVKTAGHVGKAERAQASKQQRSQKRQEILERKRKVSAPVVVALLPLSADVDTDRLYSSLLTACETMGRGAGDAGDGMDLEDLPPAAPLGLQTVAVAGRNKLRVTLVPPPPDREDLLQITEIARSAEVLLLVLPGAEGAQAVDAAGASALAVLRSMGLPSVMGVVQNPAGAGVGSMKERSASKRRAEKGLTAHLPGDHRMFHIDTADDCSQLVRHLAEHPAQLPQWRQWRPSLMVEEASYEPSSSGQGQQQDQQQEGVLKLTGYVRGVALSADQLVTIPGLGDFQIQQIQGPPDPWAPSHKGRGDHDMQDSEPVVLALPSADQDQVVRENEPDDMDGEQTWPTEQELMDAEMFAQQQRRKRVPKGTSAYQAAWILDDEGDDDEDEEGGSEEWEEAPEEDAPAPQLAAMAEADEGAGLELEEDPGTDAMVDDEDEDEGRRQTMYEEAVSRREAERDDEQYPDEVDTPADQPARVRFQKYRGLKSFRTSPWDPKESLPAEYARVFAFESFKRAQKRAREAVARADVDPGTVLTGTYVTVHIAGVPADKAAALLQRVQGAQQQCQPPLVVFGLLQHESKMSVMNMGVRKAQSYSETIRSKEQLLLVTGLRSFSAQPIFSGDEHSADKFKMERFLHAGRHCMATVYAPICYPPLPVLGFKVPEGGGRAVLALVGSVRDCNPDRVVLKKVVLSGYPVRVNRRRAVVRYMFHNPDDIRWFKPVELWTKAGRRGRLTEPIGTHGAMKCLFDGPLQQRDSVCMSLYKRAFPKWPKDLTFA